MKTPVSAPAELIVALDVPTRTDALQALRQLPASVRFVKVGLELFVAEGPRVLKDVAASNRHCFLDLKFHDIPRTVANAVRTAAQHHVFMLTVHAHGGATMLRAAAEAAAECGTAAPRIVAVTTLTSLNQDDLAQIGVTRPIAAHTLALGQLAIASGCDGLVCSPLEVAFFRRDLGVAPLIVTPGVRPAGAARGDQKRVATPAEAVRAGSSFLVVGRPILDAPDPAAAAESVLQDMRSAQIS
ncbi:MAG: orotidine-5'-phosphate decarboxylase [Lentisphaerae bacterium]|nr:orotidine-5'-phosphate decarboxylase [Lentisphaerota bacterium]